MIVHDYPARRVRQKSGMFEAPPVIKYFGDECNQENNFYNDDIIDVASPIRFARFTQLRLLQLNDLGLHVIAQNLVAVLNQPPKLKKKSNTLRNIRKVLLTR